MELEATEARPRTAVFGPANIGSNPVGAKIDQKPRFDILVFI